MCELTGKRAQRVESATTANDIQVSGQWTRDSRVKPSNFVRIGIPLGL